jgi:UDP-N-acetylglucosamine--dolichyl-phosphate N-acetylglucosaminephosphotransferase
MELLIASAFISFISTYVLTEKFIRYFKSIGLVARDLQKPRKPILPTSGGVPVAFGILLGLLFYVGMETFLFGNLEEAVLLLAISASILLVTFVGLFDDLKNPLGKSNYEMRRIRKRFIKAKSGLPQTKWILTLPAAIPLMVINAGESVLTLPLIGPINFGILYPLLLIPIGFVGASNAINLLAGFNGSEAGMGIVYLGSLAILSLINQSFISILFIVSIASLIAFLKFNWFPAKFLPGDTLTYLLGSIVASGVIVGNMEKAGIILLTPFIIEFLLKSRSRFKASCLGRLRRDGKLSPPYGKKIYSITHVLMNLKRISEREVTISLILMEILIAIFLFVNTFYLQII